MNRKGFTLTELLVVMVILGIITAISIPLVRNIQQSNIQKQYQNYMDSVKYGAKLYVDSYGEDLFGYNQSGCAIISYQELKDKNLIKDFDKDGMSCASEDTYVRVVKVGTKYGYAVSIGCGKKDSYGNVNVSYQYPKEGMSSSSTCGVDANAIMAFRTNITNPNSFNYKTRSMKVIISSDTGISSDPMIQYGFSDIKNGAAVSSWNELVVKPESIDRQIEKITSGETIEVTSEQIQTPPDLTGRYYLVLRIDRLQDANRDNWSNGTDVYVYLGPYQLDNTKPEFNDSTVISSNTSYNALKPKLALKVTDEPSAPDEASAKRRLKMCISFGTDTCKKTKTAFEGYEAYSPNKVLDKIKDALDGSRNKVFVTVVDPAGNYQTKEFSYELASVITYNGNGSTGGSTAKTYCNNNTDCPLRENGFEKEGYDYTGWFNKKTGGTKYGKTVKLTGNIKVYAGWSMITYKINYELDGGDATNKDSYTVETATFTLNNPTKTGYTFTGWTGSNGTKKQKTVKIEKGSTGDKNYTAHYSINSYTLTYDMNGHGSCKPTSITKEYNQKWGTLCEPTATGFEFKGWKNGTTTVTADSKATDDITVTAQWETKDNIFIYTVSEANQCKNKNDCSNVLKCTEGCTLKIDSRTKITITAPITTNWNVEFYQSGTLESTNTVSVDLHAVGGGGSGASGGGGTSEASHWRAGGGGGGYVNYAKGKTLTKQKYTVTVGAGGIAPGYHQDGNQGGTSSFGSLVSAAGGYGGTTCDGSKDFCHQAVPTSGNGGSGGSGGGASGLSWDDNGSFKTGGNGGSNGSDGTTNTNHLAGKGQNSSTRDFGEASGTLRAGGGGGRGGYQSAGGVYLTANGTGGSGGGGNGAKSNSTGTDSNSCTPPTPGDNKFGGGGGAGGGNYSGCQNGAAGGSGIVIMRNKR